MNIAKALMQPIKTKNLAKVSKAFANGDLSSWINSSSPSSFYWLSCFIRFEYVNLPTAKTNIFAVPSNILLPPLTKQFFPLEIGYLDNVSVKPVIILSSTSIVSVPSISIPSTVTLSPGFIVIISPTTRSRWFNY